MNPPPRYLGSEFIGPDYYGYEGINNRAGFEIYNKSGINDESLGKNMVTSMDIIMDLIGNSERKDLEIYNTNPSIRMWLDRRKT